MIIGSLLLCLGALTGCGEKRPDGMPKTYPCELTLTQGGKPLVKAQVMLYAKEAPCPWTVGGSTDENGVAEINTHGKYKGAPNGDWIVTVSKNIVIYKDENDDTGDVYSKVELDYMNRETTPLELKTDGKTKAALDVGEEVEIYLEDVNDR